jgi:CheY-like chemotaxis protein
MPFPKGRILYCEDDFDSRELMRFLFSHTGYEIVCAENGVEALRLAQNDKFDLFILDNWMPSMTGLELTQHIRTFNQITPILFYSGAAYRTDMQAALNAGAQGYLTKPERLERLLAEARRLIGHSDF